MAKILHEPRRGVAKVERHRLAGSLPRAGQRPAPSLVEAVGLGASGQVNGGLGESQLAFGRAQEPVRVPAGHQPARDVHGILAGVQHPSQPVEGGVGISAAHGLVQGRDVIVVLVSGLVVDGETVLDRNLDGFGGQRAALAAHRRRAFQDAQRASGVAVGCFGDAFDNLPGRDEPGRAESPFVVGEGVVQNPREVVPREGVEDDHRCAGQEGAHHLEAGVLGRGTDQDDLAGLHDR